MFNNLLQKLGLKKKKEPSEKEKKVKLSAGEKKEIREYKKGKRKLEDLLAPAGVKIEPKHIQIGDKYARTLFVLAYPRYLHTAWLSPVINLDRRFDVSLFIHPLESNIILKQLQKKVGEVGAEIKEREEKGMVRDPKLETAYKDLEELRDRLQTGQERFFKLGVYITVYEDTLEKLDEAAGEIKSTLESLLVYSKPALFIQEAGFNSTLPLGRDRLQIFESMNTQPLSTIFPFVSSDLTSDKGILYGINRHNSSLVLFDRFSLENANTVIFGKSGAGKSYAVKAEILRSLMMGTEFIVIDPEEEYQYLAETVGGSYVKISLASPYHINPFDVPEPREDEDPANVLRSHFATLTGLIKLILGDLNAEEEAIMDKAIRETYATRDITPENPNLEKKPPRMEDLQEVLSGMEGAESLATRLDKYTHGTFAGFLNNYTNVDINKKMVVFNIRDLEDELRPIAMYVILNFVWRIVRKEMKKRVLVVDEAWWLMKHEASAYFLYSMAKRARKYYLGLTTISQDVSDFMASEYGEPIITNSSLQLLLKQSPATIDQVKELFNLTEEEKYLLLEADVGEGLFFAGLKHIAIKVVASYTEDQIITSDPKQLQEIEQAKKELAQTAE